MPDSPRDILRQRVKLRLETLEKSARAVSLAIGANAGYVRDVLDPKKDTMPGGERLDRLAAELETTSDWLLAKTDDERTKPETVRSDVTFHNLPKDFRGEPSAKPLRVVGTAYCADLVIEEGGENVEVERLQLDVDHTVRLIPRPEALWNSPDAYAIVFQGTSMERHFYQGGIGYVDPRRPPGRGQTGLFHLVEEDGGRVVTAMVKELEKMNDQWVTLRQYNPELSFRIPRRRVAKIERVFRLDELVGFL